MAKDISEATASPPAIVSGVCFVFNSIAIFIIENKLHVRARHTL